MIKKLAASIRQYKKVSALAMLFTVLELGLDILIPRVMADLIDKGIDQGNMNVVLGYGAVLLLQCGAGADLRCAGRPVRGPGGLRLCPQPAPGYVLPGTGFFLLQH